jgi:hypothetical protein
MHGWGYLCLKYREKLHGVPKSFTPQSQLPGLIVRQNSPWLIMESAGQMPSNLVIGAMIQVTAAGSAGSSSSMPWNRWWICAMMLLGGRSRSCCSRSAARTWRTVCSEGRARERVRK